MGAINGKNFSERDDESTLTNIENSMRVDLVRDQDGGVFYQSQEVGIDFDEERWLQLAYRDAYVRPSTTPCRDCGEIGYTNWLVDPSFWCDECIRAAQ